MCWVLVQHMHCTAGYRAHSRVNLTPVDKLSFRCLCIFVIIINERRDHKPSPSVLSALEQMKSPKTFANLSPCHSTCGLGCTAGDRYNIVLVPGLRSRNFDPGGQRMAAHGTGRTKRPWCANQDLHTGERKEGVQGRRGSLNGPNEKKPSG